MNQPLISVIIPVFNKRRYLERCVRSALDQGLVDESFEIVIVDDGSTDGSLEVCKDLETANPSLRVISQRNQGASSARNAGIDAAKGEYVCFLDADDTYSPGGLSSIAGLCDGETDVIRFWCEVVNEGKEREIVSSDGQVGFKGTGKEWIRTFGLETFCVNCLFRRDFLNSRGIRFRDGILGEDYRFMFEVLMADPAMISVNSAIYFYDIALGGITVNCDKEHSRRCEKSLRSFLTMISKEVDTNESSDPELWSKSRLSLDFKVLSLFSRILLADYSLKDFRNVLASCKDAGLLSFMDHKGLSSRTRLATTAVKLMSAVPMLYIPASRLYKWTHPLWFK